MLLSKNKIFNIILVIALLTATAFAIFFRPLPHFAYISLNTPSQVQIEYLWQSDVNQQICQEKLLVLDEVVMGDCPDCILTKIQCLSQLNPEQRDVLNASSLPYPSIRNYDSFITFKSATPLAALEACKKIQGLTKNLGHNFNCLPSHSLAASDSGKPYGFWLTVIEISLSLIIVGCTSWFICFLILRYESLHEHLSHDHSAKGPQKFHAMPVPRVGGLALFVGLITGLAIKNLLFHIHPHVNDAQLFFILAAIPVFFGGLIEDVTKKVSVSHRLLFSLLSSALAIWLLGAVIDRTDIPYFDEALLWGPIAVAFTILSISGVCNAMNIIDGFNGLSSGYAVTALIALIAVAFQVNDHLVLSLAVTLLASLLGFLCWNWPKGKIFMGDGGAYLVGFSLAELCIMLLYRNESVSPWFTASIMAYPIFETLFSMFRRKFLNKSKTGQPDAEHLHQLIFKKLVLKGKPITPESLAELNGCVAIYVLAPAAIVAIVAVLFWQSTAVLMPLTLMGCVAYVLIYRKLLSSKN